MDDQDYEQLEKDQEEAEKLNNQLLSRFQEYLESKSLKSTTIKNHVSNVRMYANHYLLRYDIIPVEKGALEIGNYLGDFYIRKSFSSSPNKVKEHIISFKKFYTFLNEIKMLETKELKEMKQLIEWEKDDWIEYARTYLDKFK